MWIADSPPNREFTIISPVRLKQIIDELSGFEMIHQGLLIYDSYVGIRHGHL